MALTLITALEGIPRDSEEVEVTPRARQCLLDKGWSEPIESGV